MSFLNLTITTWLQGGIMMLPLALFTFVVYFSLFLLKSDIHQKIGKKYRKIIKKEFIKDSENIEDLHQHFVDYEHFDVLNFKDRLNNCSKLIGVLPLMGLLGTVLGMIYLFSIMGTVSTNTINLLAGGISKALYPPLIGIAASLPALFIVSSVKQELTRYEYFFLKTERKAIRKMIKEKNEK